MVIQWFGVAWAGMTLIGMLGVALVIGVALGPVRRADGGAGFILAATAALAGVALAGEPAVALVGSVLMRSWEWGADASLLLQDAWSLLLPLLHALALAAVAMGALRLVRRP